METRPAAELHDPETYWFVTSLRRACLHLSQCNYACSLFFNGLSLHISDRISLISITLDISLRIWKVCRNILVLFWLIDNFCCIWKPSALQELSGNMTMWHFMIQYFFILNSALKCTFFSVANIMQLSSAHSVDHRESPAVLWLKDLWRDVVSLSVLLMCTFNLNTQGQDKPTFTYGTSWSVTAVCSALTLTGTLPLTRDPSLRLLAQFDRPEEETDTLLLLTEMIERCLRCFFTCSPLLALVVCLHGTYTLSWFTFKMYWFFCSLEDGHSYFVILHLTHVRYAAGASKQKQFFFCLRTGLSELKKRLPQCVFIYFLKQSDHSYA